MTLVGLYSPTGYYNAEDEMNFVTKINEDRKRYWYDSFKRECSSFHRIIENAGDLHELQKALWDGAIHAGIVVDYPRLDDDERPPVNPDICSLRDLFSNFTSEDYYLMRLVQEAIWKRARELGLEPEYPTVVSEEHEGCIFCRPGHP